jgi:hypothetical protein
MAGTACSASCALLVVRAHHTITGEDWLQASIAMQGLDAAAAEMACCLTTSLQCSYQHAVFCNM